MSPPAGRVTSTILSRACRLALLISLVGPVDHLQAQVTRNEAMPRSFDAPVVLILSAPDDSDRGESRVGSVSTFIPPSGDSAPEQTVALGAGTFIGFAGADVAFLHLLGSYERRLFSNVELVAEGGLVTYEDNLFAAIAPALKLGLTSESRPSLFARAGPAFFGTTSGGLVLVHVGTGIDLAGASNGLRFEARTYVSPSHVSFDLLEVMLSYQFDPWNGTR